MIDEKKLIERLWEQHKGIMANQELYADAEEVANEICQVISIIDEQPKTDWIPCEERLPVLDEGNEYFKQSKCVLVALEWWDGEITEEVGWYNEGGSWNYDAENCKVIAWQPLPAPYKKEGAE